MGLPSTTLSPSVINIAETSRAVSMTTVYSSVSPTTTAVLTTVTAMVTTAAIIGIAVAAFIMVFGIITIVLISFMVRKHKKTKLAPLDTVCQQKSENNYIDRNEFTPDHAVVSTTPSTIASDSTAVDIHDPPYMEARSEYLSTHQEPTKPKEPVYADLHHSTNPPAAPLPVSPTQYATVREQTDNTISTQSEENKEDSQDDDHSTNPLAPSPAAEPVPAPGRPLQQEPVYADLPHSTTGRPAPTPSVEQTDNTVTTQSNELQYAQVQHCTTGRPAPPLPVEPVQYATVKKPQTDSTVTSQTEANIEPVQYGDNSNNKHPLSCEGSSSGYHSASALSGDLMPTMASVSTGNDEKVFLQSTPYRPDNSKCADNGLLYSDTEDAGGQVSWSANPSMDMTSNHLPNQHVVPSATYIANTTPVVKNSRCGGLLSDKGDSQTGSVQQFQCQLDASNDDISVEELCLSEDEGTLLSASIVASEHTLPRIEIHSGMEQNDDGSVKQAQLLITVEKPAEINNEEHEVVFGWTKPRYDEEDMQTTESLSLFDAPSTMEQASVSKQPHEVQWMYKSEVSALSEHIIDTSDAPDFYSFGYPLISSSIFDEQDDHDAFQPTVASKANLLLWNGTREPTLLKMVNKETSMDESTSFGCRLLEEEAYKKNDNNSSPLSDDSLIPPNSGHLSSPSPAVSFSLPPFNDSACAMISNESPSVLQKSDEVSLNAECPFATSISAPKKARSSVLQESPAVESDEVSPNVECPSVTTSISALKKAFAFGRPKTSLRPTFSSHTSPNFPSFSSFIAGIIAGKVVTEKLQSLELSFSKMLADIKSIRKRRFGWYPYFMCREKHLDRSHVDIFNTYYLENQFMNEEINRLIEAYKRERDQFIESTTVLEFQEAVSSTAEFAVPEGKECIKIEVSKNWAIEKKLKDVISLAQRVFGDNYKSLIGFNVVSRMGLIFITWLFPKRLKAKLQELVSTRRAVFRQEDVRKVKVGDLTAFSLEWDIFATVFDDCIHYCFESVRKVSESQCYGTSYSLYCTPSITSLSSSLTEEELVKVCKNVDDWYKLGIHLRLSEKQLNDIRNNYSHLGTEAMKRRMFDVWLKNTPGASWTDLITALREIGEEVVACMIEVVKVSAIRWENSFFFEDDVQSLINKEKSIRCSLLSLLNTIGSCQKLTCRVRRHWSSHEVLKVAYHHKWPFKDDLQVVSEKKEKSKLKQLCTKFYPQLVEAVSDTCHSLTSQLHSTSLLSEEKKAVLSSSVVHILVELEADIERLNNEQQQLEADIERLNSEQQQLEADIERPNSEQQQLEADIERLNSEKADLLTRLHCFEEDLETADELFRMRMRAVSGMMATVHRRDTDVEEREMISCVEKLSSQIAYLTHQLKEKDDKIKAQHSIITSLLQNISFAHKTVNLQKCRLVICLPGKGQFRTVPVPVHRGHLIEFKVQLLNNNLSAIECIITEKLSRKLFHRTCENGQMDLTHYLITENNCNSRSQFSTTVNDHTSLVLTYLTYPNIEQHSKDRVLALHIAYEGGQMSIFLHNWNELLSQSRNPSKQLQLLNLSSSLKSITELENDSKSNCTKHEDAAQSVASVQPQNVTEPCPDQELNKLQATCSLRVTAQKSALVNPMKKSFHLFSIPKATLSKNCSHDICSGWLDVQVMPIKFNGNASRLLTLLQQQYYASSLVQILKESKYECTEIVNRKVTQLNAPLDTTEEYSAEEDNGGFCVYDNLSYYLFKNTNKSDLLYAAGKAMLFGAASLMRDMESQFTLFTETQSNISGVISAMWSYSMIPTVNSFTDQLAGGGLLQLIC